MRHRVGIDGAAVMSRLPLPLDEDAAARRERAVAEISDAVARGDYEVRAEDVADAIVRFHRRSPDTGEEDRLAPRR